MSGIDATAYVMRLVMKTPAHKLALLAVAARCDQNYSCYPSRALIAGEALVSDVRAKTILRELRRDGYLSARQRYRENGSKTSNRYFVHGPWDRWNQTGEPFREIEYYADRDDRYAAIRDGEFIPRPSSKRDEQDRQRGGIADDPSQDGEGGGVMGDPSPGIADDPSQGVMGDPSITGHYEPALEKMDAPSARSALDAVGQTSGSGTPGTGGSAATAKTQPPRSRDDWAAIHAVREELGRTIPDLNTALGEATPRSLADAILTGLATGTPAERTPQQLIRHRVLPRWNGYWATRYYAGELREQPFGATANMLAPHRSDHDRCDERVNVDTGAPCTPCTMRAKDRRHTRRQDRQEARQRPGEATPAAPVPGPRTPPTPKRAEPEAAPGIDPELAARLAQATRAAAEAGQDDRDTCPGDDGGKPCGRPTSRGRCWRHLAAAVSAGA